MMAMSNQFDPAANGYDELLRRARKEPLPDSLSDAEPDYLDEPIMRRAHATLERNNDIVDCSTPSTFNSSPRASKEAVDDPAARHMTTAHPKRWR